MRFSPYIYMIKAALALYYSERIMNVLERTKAMWYSMEADERAGYYSTVW